MQKRKRAPGAQDRGSLPRLAHSATFHFPLTPSRTAQCWSEQVDKQQACFFEDRGQGKCPHSKNSTVSILFFYLSKIVCVNQAWWPVPVSPSLRRLRQARPCPGKTKESDAQRAALYLQASSLSLSLHLWARWPPMVPSPADILDVLGHGLSCVATNRDS